MLSTEKKERIIIAIGNHSLGKRLIRFLGRDYLAGSSLEKGFAIMRAYLQKGRRSAFDILGEDARSREEADRYLEAYKKTIDHITSFYKENEVTVSIKPTSICAIDGYKVLASTPLLPRHRELVSYAKSKNVNVTIDMEDHHWTDYTLMIVQTLWKEGYDNLGVALQSRLKRTPEDIKNLFFEGKYHIPKEKIKVRIVIGVYREPPFLATNNREEAKRKLVDQAKQLFRAGVYVKIATHDHRCIRELIQFIRQNNIPPTRFEFQFLKGVQNAYKIEKELLSYGYIVRYYMPVELRKYDGTSYMVRRLLKNPDFMRHGIKNFFQKLFTWHSP